MPVSVSTSPHSIGFSQNPLIVNFSIDSIEGKKRPALALKVYFQDFHPITNQPFWDALTGTQALLYPFDESRNIIVQLNELIHPYLVDENHLPDIPDIQQSNIKKCGITNRIYRFSYTEIENGDFTDAEYEDSNPFRITSGGVSWLRYGYEQDSYLKQNLGENLLREFLTWKPNPTTVTPIQPEYLTFLLPQTIGEVKVAGQLRFKGQSDWMTFSTDLIYSGAGYDKIIIPVNPYALGLDPTLIDAYRVYLVDPKDSLTPITVSKEYKLTMHLEPMRYYLFLNSLGGIDTLCTDALREIGIEVQSQTAIRHTTHNYNPHQGSIIDFNNSTIQNYQTETGWLKRCDAAWIEELIRRNGWAAEVRFCQDCYACPDINSAQIYIPIRPISNSIQYLEDQASIFRISFEYQQAYSSTNFSPIPCQQCEIATGIGSSEVVCMYG